MPSFSSSLIQDYRKHSYFISPGQRVASLEEAVEFINRRGFAFFWPIKGVELPSLWVAAAGNRPVADAHDDPGHITWDWKDRLLGQHKCYYGRVIRHRNAFISLDALPYFYALSPNFGDPENDYLEQYDQGVLTAESKAIYEALLHEGAMDTISLRKAARMSSRESDGRFNKALDDLQMEFKILPIGVAPVGAWKYAFIYELTHRHFPDLIEQAGTIYEAGARQQLARLYLESVGAAPVSQLARIFNWKPDLADKTLKPLVDKGAAVIASHPGDKLNWVGLPSLVGSTEESKE